MNNNASLFEDDEGDCVKCRQGKNNCDCYGKIDPDRVMLAADSAVIGELLAECRGLHYDNIDASPLRIPSMRSAPFIPIATGGSRQLFSKDSTVPSVGITLQDALNNAKTHAKQDIRRSCGVPDASKIILLMHGNDVTLEKFSKHQRVIFKELAMQDIYLYVAPNYSVWEGHPDFERLINMKLQLVSYDLMSKAGLPTVPHFLWRANMPEDLKRIAVWLNTRPTIHTIAINLQTYGSPSDWHQVIGELQTLHGLLDRRIHFIIVGPATDMRITMLTQALGGNFTLMSARPAILAWARSDLTYSQGHIRRHEYARSPKGQVSLLGPNYPPADPLEVAKLFATSNASLTSCVVQARRADIVSHARAAMSMRPRVQPKTVKKYLPRRRPSGYRAKALAGTRSTSPRLST